MINFNYRYECLPGMMASDGTNTTTIDCQNDGTWSEPAIDCDCKIFSGFELFEIKRTYYLGDCSFLSLRLRPPCK